MKLNKSFDLLRWRLAFWYTGVMGLGLSVCGLAVYEAIVHVQRLNVQQELEIVIERLHEQLVPVLKQPGHLDRTIEQRFPGLCVIEFGCQRQLEEPQRDFLETLDSHDFYVRLLNPSGQPIAKAGQQPQQSPSGFKQEQWQTLRGTTGDAYRQISLPLRTQDNRIWGTLQVGRSLNNFDRYVLSVRLTLLLGLPLAMILIGGSSYWLIHLAMQPAYQSYKKMQEFTSDAAHELRTPLAATLATVDSALRLQQMPEAEARDILKAVRRQTLRLTQLAGDLLFLSNADQQPVMLKQMPCRLPDIVNDLVEEFGAMATAAKITLTAEVQTSELLQILGDEEQLYCLISNLISNAIRYTPAGGQVKILLYWIDHQARLQVQDTGIGISAEDQARIFDRFYRVNADRSRHTGGAGLGLSIAQAISQAHGGSLRVQSQLGEGSIFTLQLPLT